MMNDKKQKMAKRRMEAWESDVIKRSYVNITKEMLAPDETTATQFGFKVLK